MGFFSTLANSDKPKFKKLKEEGCLVTFSIEISAGKVQEEAHTLLLRIQQRARLPGFRPGKAPIGLVKKQFAAQAREETLHELIRRYVPEALRELGLSPVAAPVVSDLSLEENRPLLFKVRVEVPPQVSPKDYAKIPVQRRNYQVSSEALERRISDLREANARLERAAEESVAKDHYVVIDYLGFRDGKPLPQAKGESELVDISSDQTLEGLAEGLQGLKRGEKKEIPVTISQKPAALQVTVKEIKRKILPPLDAEFAKDLGFTSLSELRAKLREVMEAEGRQKAEREVTQQIEEALLKANRIPLPPSLVQAQLEQMLERLRHQLLGPRGQWSEKQLEDLRLKLLPKAEDELRLSYILPAVAERENLKVLEEDLQAELERNLGAAETPDKKENLRRLFEEKRESISGLIRDRKAMALIREKAALTEVAAVAEGEA